MSNIIKFQAQVSHDKISLSVVEGVIDTIDGVEIRQ